MLGKSDSAKHEAELAEQRQQQTAVAELLSLHPWAGRDLVQVRLAHTMQKHRRIACSTACHAMQVLAVPDKAVCAIANQPKGLGAQAVLAGLGGDRQAAAQCLDEMLAARLTQQRRSSDTARRSSDSGAAPSAGHTPDAALQDAAAAGGGAAAAGSAAHAWPAEPPDDHELAADLEEEPYRCNRGLLCVASLRSSTNLSCGALQDPAVFRH